MDKNPQNFIDYLRLSVSSINLMQHVKIKLNQNEEALQLSFTIKYLQNNTSIKTFSYSQFLSENNNRFEQKSKLWNITQVLSYKNPSLQASLQLQFQLFRKQKAQKDIESIFTQFIEQKHQQKSNLKPPQQSSSIVTSKIKQKSINLPFSSPKIKIPLKKFSNLPYMNHEVAIDFYLQNNLSNNKDKNQANKQRDGIINLKLMYLPMIRYQAIFKEISLASQKFYSDYSLQIEREQQKEIHSKNNIQKNKGFKKVNRQKLIIPLKMVSWHKYQNKQSFNTQFTIPLNMSTDNSKIKFLLIGSKDEKKQNFKEDQNHYFPSYSLDYDLWMQNDKKSTDQYYEHKIILQNNVQLSFKMKILLKNCSVMKQQEDNTQNQINQTATPQKKSFLIN